MKVHDWSKANKWRSFDKNGDDGFAPCIETISVVNGNNARMNRNKRSRTIMKRLLTLSCAIIAVTALTANAGDAKENFAKSCAKCHGKEGKGDTKMGAKLDIKDLTDAKVQDSFKDEDAVKAIKEGLKDKDGKLQMKPIEGLSDEEVTALVKFVRTLKK
jgi:mono/diheme cytochrome c family protein